MNNDLKEYVERLKERLKEKNELVNIYYKEGNKLIKMFSSNSYDEIVKQMKKYVDDYEHDEGDTYIITTLKIQTKSFLHGPISLSCILIVIDDKGNANITTSKTATIRYTVHDLETRGYKNGDYKRLYNKMKKGLLINPKKIYTAKFLDNK